MICITDFLAHIRLTMKLQEQMLKNICETWQLTITEGKVISFLYNNPGKSQNFGCSPKEMYPRL